MGFGDYPDEYNPEIHGTYDPGYYYGKPDTPFGDVKLNALVPWLSRRKKTPRAFAALCSRAFWRWQHKYIHPRRGGVAPLFQVAAAGSIFFYLLNYPKYRAERGYKYH